MSTLSIPPDTSAPAPFSGGPADAFDYESALEACARGERFALRALYDRESRWLLGVAERIVRDRDVAHDVLQDAFLLVWQRSASFQRALGSGRGWIYTVVRHKALDALRRNPVEMPAGDDLDQHVEAHAARHSADSASGLADRQAIDRCLDRLDEQRRECVLYAFVDGYTHPEIAARTGLPVGTVKTWIRRSLQSLKECLS